MLGVETITISDPEGVRHVLTANAGNYRRPYSVTRIARPLVGSGLFLSEGSDWRPSASTAGADIHTCYHWTAVELISAAYARDERFALFVETLAITGARPSQVSRIEVGDLRAADLAEAKLMMPRSGRRRTASRPKESRAHQRADHRSLGGAAEGGGGRPAL